LIATGSSMQAIAYTAPPPSWLISMSILKTRFRHYVHAMDARRSSGVRNPHRLIVFAITSLRRGDQSAVLTVGGKHTVKSSHVDSRLGH